MRFNPYCHPIRTRLESDSITPHTCKYITAGTGMSLGVQGRAVAAQTRGQMTFTAGGKQSVERQEDLTILGLRKILRLSSVTHPQASSAPGTQDSATVRRQQQVPASAIPEWPSPVPSRAPTTVVAVAETGKSRGGDAQPAPRQHKPVASNLRAWVLLSSILDGGGERMMEP